MSEATVTEFHAGPSDMGFAPHRWPWVSAHGGQRTG